MKNICLGESIVFTVGKLGVDFYLMVTLIYGQFEKNAMATITKDIGITELVQKHPESIPIMVEAGLHCIGCMAAQFETLEQGCAAHGIDTDELIKKINEAIKEK